MQNETTDSDEAAEEQTEELNFRLIALRELFDRDSITVSETDEGNVSGDYKVSVTDGCFSQSMKLAVRSLGFKERSTHSHIVAKGDHIATAEMREKELTTELAVYLDDDREGR